MLRNSRGVVNFDSRRDGVSSKIKCETRRLCARCKNSNEGLKMCQRTSRPGLHQAFLVILRAQYAQLRGER